MPTPNTHNGKGKAKEKKKDTHWNAEFQRIARGEIKPSSVINVKK